MKKFLVSILLPMLATTISAQLRVHSDGTVNVGNDFATPNIRLSCVDSLSLTSPILPDTARKIGIASFSYPTAVYNYGLMGFCVKPMGPNGGTPRTYGVYGLAGRGSSGHNYGVFGCLADNANGAAVYGTNLNANGITVPGIYAAYFHGNACITGTATITHLVTPSDENLKEDIAYLSSDGKDREAHSRLMDVNVISYKYKPHFYIHDASEEPQGEDSGDTRTHYGVSAQELRQLFPDLVEEGQDGYLAVNYQELIPMLICSVQQLQRELDELRGQGVMRSMSKSEETADIGDAIHPTRCVLHQNSPNPFRGSSTIKYSIPKDAKDALICVFNMQGTMLSQTPVSGSTDRITINGSDYGPGMYIYSLIVNGREMDSKRMILTK